MNVLYFVADWVTDHILKQDMEMAKYLISKGMK